METGRFADLDLLAPAYSAWHSITGAERDQLIRTAVSDALTTLTPGGNPVTGGAWQ